MFAHNEIHESDSYSDGREGYGTEIPDRSHLAEYIGLEGHKDGCEGNERSHSPRPYYACESDFLTGHSASFLRS